MSNLGFRAKIDGVCQPGFEAVKEAFSREFEAGNELGASVCITLEGQTVVDLWAGYKDEARTEPWQRDTLANVYSTTKGITAIAAHRLGNVESFARELVRVTLLYKMQPEFEEGLIPVIDRNR